MVSPALVEIFPFPTPVESANTVSTSSATGSVVSVSPVTGFISSEHAANNPNAPQNIVANTSSLIFIMLIFYFIYPYLLLVL